jgi:hypothetical protein
MESMGFTYVRRSFARARRRKLLFSKPLTKEQWEVEVEIATIRPLREKEFTSASEPAGTVWN